MKKQTSKQKQAEVHQEHTLPQPLTGHSDTVEQIEISTITVSANNPRRSHTEADIRELADSITMHGVIHPITLRSSENGYMIVCGERRYRAAMMAGLTVIPAIVRPYTGLSKVREREQASFGDEILPPKECRGVEISFPTRRA